MSYKAMRNLMIGIFSMIVIGTMLASILTGMGL